MSSLSKMKVAELKEIAKEAEIEGYSSMKKDALVAAITKVVGDDNSSPIPVEEIGSIVWRRDKDGREFYLRPLKAGAYTIAWYRSGFKMKHSRPLQELTRQVFINNKDDLYYLRDQRHGLFHLRPLPEDKSTLVKYDYSM